MVYKKNNENIIAKKKLFMKILACFLKTWKNSHGNLINSKKKKTLHHLPVRQGRVRYGAFDFARLSSNFKHDIRLI